jgi:hypothetical protein
MVDRGRARDVNEAARRFAETLADSYRLVYAQAQESAARQQQRAREFSELVATNLREQTEAGRSGAERLSVQAERQREAGQELARESVEAYAEFLDDAFSRYRSGTERASQTVQEGAMASGRTATGPRASCAAYGPRVPRRASDGGWPRRCCATSGRWTRRSLTWAGASKPR